MTLEHLLNGQPGPVPQGWSNKKERGLSGGMFLRVEGAVIEGNKATALPGYRWIGELDAIPRHLRGVHPANPVNLAPRGGVQLELPPRVRRAESADYDRLVTTLSLMATDARHRCTGAVTRAAPASPPLR